jgi:hypothetical protein
MVWGSNPGRVKRLFFYPKCSDWLWGSPSLLLNRYWGSFHGLKWAKPKCNYSPPSGAKVRMSGAVPVLPLYAFVVWIGKALLLLLLYFSYRTEMLLTRRDGTQETTCFVVREWGF